MLALRSLCFNLLFFAWTCLLLLLFLPLIVLPSRFMIEGGRFWVRGVFAMLAGICGLRHEFRGLENLPAEPCILASKHQSAWDTIAFPLAVDGPSYIFKRELLWLPLFGWYLRHGGGIPVDRKGGAAALRGLVAEAQRALSRGQYIVIFPEGTRMAPGQKRPYHPGTAALYGRLGVPVVPVAVNSGFFWARRGFLKRPGLILLEFLPPIAPGLPREEFTHRLQDSIETASRRLAARG